MPLDQNKEGAAALNASKKLTAATNAIGKDIGALEGILKKNTKIEAKQVEHGPKFLDSVDSLHGALGGLGKSMFTDLRNIASPVTLLSKAITDGIKQAEETQIAALRMGSNVSEIIKSYPGDFANATGGFANNITATFKQADIGMKDLDLDTAKLASRTATLNGNIDGLVKAQRRMQTHLGMNSTQVGESSRKMMILSDQYNISTDRLVTALDSLSEHFGTMAALGISQGVQDSVMELTAKYGAGNEKLITQFTGALMKTGGDAVAHAVVGGVHDLQNAVLAGTASTAQIERGMLDQGRKYLDHVRQMQANGAQMNVALDTLKQIYGPGAEAAMALAQAYDNMAPAELEEMRVNNKLSEEWGNALSVIKEEILSPIKTALAERLPAIVEQLKTFVPLFKGILKAAMITASIIAIKRGAGGMLAGMMEGSPMRMMMGAGALGLGAAGLGVGTGVESPGGGLGALGLAAGALPLLSTLFSKDKGILGAFKFGFGKQGKGKGGGLFGGKLGSSESNPMYVVEVEGAGGAAENILDVSKNLKKVFGKGGRLNAGLRRGSTGILKGIARGIGPGVKKIFGRGAARAFGGFMARRMAGIAAANMVPVAGQLLTIGFLAWEGLQYFKRRKEERLYKRQEEMINQLHDREDERISEELKLFKDRMQESTNYMRITNTELRTAMRDTLAGGAGAAAQMARLSGAMEGFLREQGKGNESLASIDTELSGGEATVEPGALG